MSDLAKLGEVESSRPKLPDALIQALATLPEQTRSSRMVQYAQKYHLTREQLEFVLTRANASQLLLLAHSTGENDKIWQYAKYAWMHQGNYDLNAFLKLADGLGKRAQVLAMVIQTLEQKGVSDTIRVVCLNFLQAECLAHIQSGLPLDENMRALCERYLMHETRQDLLDALEPQMKIAAAVNNRLGLKKVWENRFLRQAMQDTSDFGEDDGRDLRIEVLYREAITVLPEFQAELAESAIQSLLAKNRKEMAAHLAKRIGLVEKSRILYRERQAEILASREDHSPWAYGRIAKCAFRAGDYQIAYGYYLLANDDWGLFRSAWEFDRANAVEIARKIALRSLDTPFDALEVARQAGIPEVAQLYQKAIERYETNDALDEALKLAQDFGDQERIARYQVLLDA